MEGIAIIVIVLIGLIIGLFLLAIIYMSRVRRPAPDQMMIYWGPTAGDDEHDYSIASSPGAFIWPFVGKYRYLSVDIRTMEVIVEDIPTNDPLDDLKIDVEFVTQVSPSPDPDKIHQAIENLMDLRDKEVNEIARNEITKAARSVLQKYTFYEVNSDRDNFAEMVKKDAEEELAKIGMEVRSLVMKKIGDKVGFNASLRMGSLLMMSIEGGKLLKFDEEPFLSKIIKQEIPDKDRASTWMRIGEFHFEDGLHPHALFCYYQAMANDPSNLIYSVKAEEALLSIKEKLITRGYTVRGDDDIGYQFWMGDEPPEISADPVDLENEWLEFENKKNIRLAQYYVRIGDKMLEEGSLRSAIRNYEEALKLDPDNIELQEKLEDARRSRGVQKTQSGLRR